ncbi:protein kinase domain-containing protein [Streptomyces sp. 6N223]|uniref:protein kinase domain-containing protein n=1 Tax=Streptomyces sp. 6N223 TaxID=3457412 RepID=UPI003FD56819
MKQGDVIGGYRIVSEPTNADGGKCMWAFAEKDGRQYFLKRFLEPKRPREGGGGSAASRRIRTEICEDFEERHRTIMKLLRPDASGGGNLVLAVDFFHEGSTYYKVTERIDTTSLEEPQALSPASKSVLLKTLGSSLRMLHDIDIVHGDLKPANVLVQKREGAKFHVAKLIDFDDSYLAGDPPGRDEIAGDSLYGAPEWRRYVQGDEAVEGAQLSAAVDVFALGLMTHLYLTGSLPGYDARFGSPADAVNAGEPLAIDEHLATPVQELIAAMTARDPAVRPTVAAFLERIGPEVCVLHAAPQPTPLPPRRVSRVRPARLPGGSPARPPAAEGTETTETTGSAETPEAETPTPPKKSRVKINLGGRTPRKP